MCEVVVEWYDCVDYGFVFDLCFVECYDGFFCGDDFCGDFFFVGVFVVIELLVECMEYFVLDGVVGVVCLVVLGIFCLL